MDQKDVRKRYEKLLADARSGGYQLNADQTFCLFLTEGLLQNAGRYGIEACPCRLVTGGREDNMDIVCPCVYRDDDLAEFGACFCGLYVNDKYDPDRQIPDRRPPKAERRQTKDPRPAQNGLAYPVWRCGVCGYLCAANQPPGKCPVCKAAGERFERFL